MRSDTERFDGSEDVDDQLMMPASLVSSPRVEGSGVLGGLLGRADLAWGVTIFVIAFAFAVEAVVGGGALFFFQTLMPEPALWACGRGFGFPTARPEQLNDFLFMTSHSLSCPAVSGVTTGETSAFAWSHLYLASVVAGLWRLFGVSYYSLLPLVGMMHGTYAVGCFAFARMFLPRAVAGIVGSVLAVSPVGLSMLFYLRDYSKAPFFIWALVLTVAAVRARTRRAFLSLSVLTGLVIALGVGFRSDALILAPVAAVGVAFVSARVHSRGTRAAAAALLILTAMIGSGPILIRGQGGGFGFYSLQGWTEPFRVNLGLEAAPYDLGWIYSDELSLSTVEADLRRFDPAALPDDPNARPGISVSRAFSRSTASVERWLPLFAGDAFTRAIKSAALIPGMYGLLAPGRTTDLLSLPASSSLVVSAMKVPLGWLSHGWTPVLAVIGLLCFLLRVSLKSPREGVFMAFTFLVMLGYPTLQFALRHFFHLEVLFWLGAASLILAPFERFDLGAARRIVFGGGRRSRGGGIALRLSRVGPGTWSASGDHASPRRAARGRGRRPGGVGGRRRGSVSCRCRGNTRRSSPARPTACGTSPVIIRAHTTTRLPP